MRTMRQVVNDSLALEQILTTVGLATAAFALLLSVMGVFGLAAYSTSRRKHEFGVRIALGATRVQLMGMVAGQGVRLAVVGAGIGLPVALLAGRALSSKLNWIAAFSSSMLVVSAFILLLAALVASLIPARRAATLDPATALRQE